MPLALLDDDGDPSTELFVFRFQDACVVVQRRVVAAADVGDVKAAIEQRNLRLRLMVPIAAAP